MPLPLPFRLGFPDELVITCYHLGMIRQFLLEACAPEERYLQRVVVDLSDKLSEDAGFLTEKLMLRYWVLSCCEYYCWYAKASVDITIPLEQFLDPPAVCFRPERKDPNSKLNRVGLLFRCYDLVRSRPAPLPLMDGSRNLWVDIVYCRLWSRATQWLDKA